MDDKTPVDRTLFIPIFISVFSVIGICLLLIASRLSAARGNVQSTDTATPLRYQFIGTEPGVVLPTDIASPTALSLETNTTGVPTIGFVLPTSSAFLTNLPADSTPLSTSASTSTPISIAIVTSTPSSVKLSNATFTPTPTISPTAQFLNVTYDDTDLRFLYSGSWVSQTGVSDTFQNTLHVSNAIGDAAQLSFVGQKIRLTYQAGPSLGAVAIKMDSVDFALDELASTTVISVWESPVLVLSSHLITITHISGGAINIDSIAVLDISTETPGP
jgi:hypothetical protein